MNSAIQSTIIDAVKKVDDEDANPSICCTRCRKEDDEHNDAIQFCQDCQLPLCDAHVILHQKNKKTKDHAHWYPLTKFQTTRNIMNRTNTKKWIMLKKKVVK